MSVQARKQTIKAIFSFLMMLGWQVSFAQLIYFSTAFDIYSFDPLTCEYTFVIRAQRSSLDIAFDRNGNFYGCNTDLNRVYLSTGSVSKIADIGGSPLNGMTISSEDIVYMGDAGGELISYDLNTQVVRHHGNIGYDCAGDLTFYKGELYMAARDNKIIKVNIEQPELSELVLTYSASFEILGIVSDYRGCDDTRVYGLTGDSTEVLLIDFDNLTGEFVCQLPFNVYGGASTSEFLASIPVSLGVPIIIQPDCQSLTGSVSFPNSSGMGELAFRLGTNDWQAQPYFGDLPAGNYSFQLLDEKGCMDSIQIELNPYPLLIIEEILVTPASCNQSNGELSIIASGGTGVLTYSLTGVWYQLQPHFTGLEAGEYDVYIKDNSGCTIKQTVQVNSTFLFDLQNYDVLHANCGEHNGAIFLYPNAMDLDKFMFKINGGSFQQESVFDNLSPGLYHIVVKHQGGCMDSIDISVGSSGSPQLLLLSSQPEVCKLRNGSIKTIVNGGTAPYQFRLHNSNWQSSEVFNDLLSGSYMVYVQDRTGCVDSMHVTVEAIKGSAIPAIATFSAQCNKSDGWIEIEWKSDQSSSSMTILNEKMEEVYNLHQLDPGYYQINITDSLGCVFDTTVTIKAMGCELTIPNIFSPNNDGVNDEFKVEVQPNAHIGINSILIYDRWGNQVYDSFSPVIDSWPVYSWDGNFRGKKCPPGVYTYKILIRDSENNVDFVFGDLALIR